jgi:uncharacterized protein YcbK (DUF882 family)
VPHEFIAPTRRTVLKGLTGIVLTAAACGIVDPSQALARATGGAARNLGLKNLHTGEVLDVTYWAEGAYRPDACRALNTMLRDWRTGDVINMDPKLFDLLHTLRHKMNSDAPFDLISGYRSPETNAQLRKNSNGVAKKSYHMRGMATAACRACARRRSNSSPAASAITPSRASSMSIPARYAAGARVSSAMPDEGPSPCYRITRLSSLPGSARAIQPPSLWMPRASPGHDGWMVFGRARRVPKVTSQ